MDVAEPSHITYYPADRPAIEYGPRLRCHDISGAIIDDNILDDGHMTIRGIRASDTTREYHDIARPWSGVNPIAQ